MLSFKRQFIVTLIILAIQTFLTIVILSNSAVAQNNSSPKKSEPSKTEPKKPEPPKTEPKVQQIAGLNAKFIFALISDGENGAWIGTEDEGVFHYTTNGKITQYTTKNGLGDNNGYALAIDKLGRLWVGHLNTGVSVFNGKDWKNYDIVDGPIGERIFDIKICPKDDDVWLATSAGLSRYRIDANKWEHLTREDGLLEDQASTLAFKSDGTLIVGTQCYGLAIFNRNEKGEYKHAQNIVAPERFGPNNCSPVPLTPRGTGLPSNLINDILVTKNSASQSIWIATSAGIVKASNDFSKLEYTRGRDYADKVYGLYGGAPKDFKKPQPAVLEQLMPEDYLTSLAEDEIGQIWVGTWRNGFMMMDPISGKRGFGTQKKSGLTDNFVTKILSVEGCNYFVGMYGGGVVKSTQPFNMSGRKPKKRNEFEAEPYSVRTEDFRHLPFPVKPSTIDELQSMSKQLVNLKKPLPKQYATYYGEDWKTQGDWLGRQVHNWAVMCAAVSPLDREIWYTTAYYKVNSFIGPNATLDDTIRRWVHWKKTDNPKVLWDPLNGYRRQAEWDDHGEAYPMSKDGPDVWYLLEVKHDGAFKLGMYFYNKDGHSGHNRMRDYIIEIYPAKEGWKGNPYNTWRQYSKDAEQVSRTMPLLAKSRVRDFWGGMYKQFMLTRGFYYVRIRRNYSYNTIISAVALERLQGGKTHGEAAGIPFVSQFLPDGNRYKYFPTRLPKVIDTYEGWQILTLLRTLDNTYTKTNGMAMQRKRRIAAYQFALSLPQDEDGVSQIVESLKWRLNQWDNAQRKEWREAMDEAFKKFYDSNESLRKSIESQKKGPPKFFLERHKYEN